VTKIDAGVLFVALGLTISGPPVALAGTSSPQGRRAVRRRSAPFSQVAVSGHDAHKSSNIGRMCRWGFDLNLHRPLSSPEKTQSVVARSSSTTAEIIFTLS